MSTKTDTILGSESSGVNQILPHKNKWAWDLYKKGKNNNWTPEEVSMTRDTQNWKLEGAITSDEKLLINRCLGFFAGSESLVGNNLFTIFRHVTDPECRQYLSRQMYEECLHNDTIVYICDSLDLKVDEVYEAYENIPSIKAKDDFLMKVATDLSNADTTTHDGRREVIKGIFLYYVICEGTFFFSGFAMLLALSDKIPGIAEQIQYTLRDESLHIEFGTTLLNKIKHQHPEIWDAEFEEELTGYIKTAVNLEIQYAKDILPRGILGLNADMFVDYMQYIANRRLGDLGFKFTFEGAKNPFPWLSETIDLQKQKNFFESKVTDYQNSGALEDDF